MEENIAATGRSRPGRRISPLAQGEGERIALLRKKPTRLNPRKARALRRAAVEMVCLSVHVDECRLIATWLWHDTFGRLQTLWDPAEIMAAWREWKKMLPFMHFFATLGVLHLDCRRPVCKRARRCACDSMPCVRHRVLSRNEALEGRICFNDFVYCMRAPEDESDQAVRGRG